MSHIVSLPKIPTSSKLSQVFISNIRLHELNKDSKILPNITLGYHAYDSCSNGLKAVKSVLQILSGPGKTIPNYSCSKEGQLAGVIGNHYSTTTIPIAQTLGIYKYTQISYGATNYLLSDRDTYPAFFRTMQNDHINYSVISKLLKYFGWTWVGLFASDDDMGEEETQILTNNMLREGICVAFTIKVDIPTFISKPVSQKIINTITKSTAQVIVITGSLSVYVAFRFQIMMTLLQSKTFIFGPIWASHQFTLYNKPLLLNGSLAIEYNTKNSLELDDFIRNVHLSNYPNDMLLDDLWIYHFKCSSRIPRKNIFFETHFYFKLHNCTGEKNDLNHVQFSFDGLTSHVTQAVNVMADGLHKMDLSLKAHSHEKKIQIMNNKHQIPISQCTDSCPPGSRKIHTSSIHTCCYDCVQCSEGEFSNVSDSENCKKCPDNEWPNNRKDQCIPKQVDFLSISKDLIAMVLTVITILLCILAAIVLGIFISHQDTPIVRANNKNLSFILLATIILSFLCVFLFLGRPVDITCMLRQASFGVLFAIAVSSLLAKTIIVCIAFKATKPSSKWKKWIGVKLPNFTVILCSSVQVMLCVIWLVVSTPFQQFDMQSFPEKIIIQCNVGSVIAFYSVLSYLGILAAISFILAFMVRTLPDSFNEAKYITFSMLVFCSVWIAMIPAYLSTKGKDTVAVEIFAILASSAGLLGCIFSPKCYIILLRPDLNSKTHLLHLNRCIPT
ncbi:vomeronasal type-2 receptor 116-like [Pelobates fuscus]|uniref:vomeronasal type-2 receptor 116-like n=1 Tax=Pelobates fuscus TaxID=191477 RepID=UPI002FE4773F